MAKTGEGSSDSYMLSGLTTPYGKRPNAVGKRFSKLARSLGFSPAFVFHSIRKTVATQFEEHGVAEGIAASILGHDRSGHMTYGVYSPGVSLKAKAEAIEKLAYPDR